MNDGVESCVDLRWIFLNDGVESCVDLRWICLNDGVESCVDLRWIFCVLFPRQKITFSHAFPTANSRPHAYFAQKIHASFHGTFHDTVHSMFAALFHDTIRSLVHELGDYGVVDSAMRARISDICTKQLHLSKLLSRVFLFRSSFPATQNVWMVFSLLPCRPEIGRPAACGCVRTPF